MDSFSGQNRRTVILDRLDGQLYWIGQMGSCSGQNRTY